MPGGAPRYERLAEESVRRGGHKQVVLIEVPPFGESENASGPARRTRLSPDREWFVQTPVEIQLRDGKVTLASQGLPSVADMP